MRVIGTAGHVDHGKSTLVRRLTGIDPDRLVEEKAREMTIDLGFAWLQIPDTGLVGVVDVPGHRDFIENMLAGVGGIDAVLFVIAADEGPMPQTREHLAILDLLGVQQGIIVLTKIDMIDDPDWIDLIEQDVRQTVKNISLANAEIVRVSAHTGAGIPHLIERLSVLLKGLPMRPDYGQPRLPIDRVFTMSGFGTVITGTLTGGALRVGDELRLYPSDIRARIRGLQSYKQSVSVAYPGSRVAVNLSGIDKQDVQRGMTAAYPDALQTSTLIDAHLRYLPDAPRPLTHNAAVKFFSGTVECTAHVRLLNNETIAPNGEAWVQFRLERPLALAQGDRYIIRLPSPPETVGGGVIVNPTPAHRWRRFQPQLVTDLETRMQGTPAQRTAQAAVSREPLSFGALQKLAGINADELRASLGAAIEEGLVVQLGDSYMAAVSYNQLMREIGEWIRNFHESQPLRAGIPREELRSRLNIKNATLSLLMGTQSELIAQGNLIKHHAHEIKFSAAQQKRIDQAMALIGEQSFTPPSPSEIAAIIGEEVLYALYEQGDLVAVQEDVLFDSGTYHTLVNGVLALIDEQGNVDAKTLRDRFNTSRKYAIGLLEHLDQIGVTKRVGDTRVRGKNAPT